MKRCLLGVVFFVLGFSSYAQDTLTVMTYNLLNFPAQNSTRYNDLREIIVYTNPDIFICSEITDNSAVNLLLNNVFNVTPVNYYAASTFVDGPDTDNLLFYNSNKLTLVSQAQVPTALRDISHYKLYSCESLDTVWYDVFSLHLKASSGWSNAQARLAECQILTNYINTLPLNTNIIVGGDFNFYGASPSVEPAWNQLTLNGTQPLRDPINMPGEWQANSLYENIHTQSTRSNANGGCCGGSTGGMDDRFDFLLINQNLIDGTAGAEYMSGTYDAIGQDGNHFNLALIEGGANTSVPANVNTALFNMSDHLPVLMQIYTCDITIGIEDNLINHQLEISFPTEEQVLVKTNYLKEEKVVAEILSFNGSVISFAHFISVSGTNQFLIYAPGLKSGVYALRLTSASGTIVRKFIR